MKIDITPKEAGLIQFAIIHADELWRKEGNLYIPKDELTSRILNKMQTIQEGRSKAKRLVLRFYGRADLKRYNNQTKKWEQTEIKLETDNPIILAFPASETMTTDYIGVYEIVEDSPDEAKANEAERQKAEKQER